MGVFDREVSISCERGKAEWIDSKIVVQLSILPLVDYPDSALPSNSLDMH